MKKKLIKSLLVDTYIESGLKSEALKRHNNLFEKIIDLDNIRLASKNAMKGKSKYKEVIEFLKDEEENLLKIQTSLRDKTFTTSKYTTFEIFDGKKREISKLPFYPDRIIHHSILNILEPIFVGIYTADTYSCIKERGVHKASFKLRKYLKDKNNAHYCLKFDITQFYPSIDNDILKVLLRRKFKDIDLLWLLDDIVDSTKGLPIGSYTSQFFANYYLTYFDHWIKETLGIKYYLRYCDDCVILSSSKKELWDVFHKIRDYLKQNLNLEIKGNYQVFPIDSRGIDWVGYVHHRNHTLIRKSIKKNYIKSKNRRNHFGWLKHCNSINLRRKYENN